jgi:hypothetical protein
MRPSDSAAFSALLTAALAFWGKDVTEFTLSVWWQACQSFELEQVEKALMAHATDPEKGEFAPKPANLVRQLHGTHTDRALMAWGRVWEAMQSVGAYASVDFSDPFIHAAISDVGGWPLLCRVPLDEVPFIQKRFCDAFRVYSARGKVDAPLMLAGESETENLALAAPPVIPPINLANGIPARKRLQ